MIHVLNLIKFFKKCPKPNWKSRPRNCLRKGDDGRARYSCIGAGDDKPPAERQLYRRDCTQCAARNASAAASRCRHRVTRYLPNIAGAASMADSISYIKNLLLVLLGNYAAPAAAAAAAAPCSSSTIQQQHHAAAAPYSSSTMQQQCLAAAAPCSSSTMQQQHHVAAGPSSFYYTYTC